MIIHYEFLEEMIRSIIHYSSKDIKIHSLHLSFNHHFIIHSSFDYKGLRSSLKSQFDIEFNHSIVIKNIQGSIHSFLFKMDLYPFLKELCKDHEGFLFEKNCMIIKLKEIPFHLSIKEIQSDAIYFDITA